MITKQVPLNHMTNGVGYPTRVSTVGKGRKARLKLTPLTGRDLRRAVEKEMRKNK